MKIYVTCIHVCVVLWKVVLVKHVAAELAILRRQLSNLRAHSLPQFSLLLSVASLV